MVASCSGLLVHEPLDQIAQLGFSAEHHDFVFGSVARGHLRELEPRGIASHCVDRTLPSLSTHRGGLLLTCVFITSHRVRSVSSSRVCMQQIRSLVLYALLVSAP